MWFMGCSILKKKIYLNVDLSNLLTRLLMLGLLFVGTIRDIIVYSRLSNVVWVCSTRRARSI